MSNENVEIRVLGSGEGYAEVDDREERQVTEIVRSRLLAPSSDEYYRADVKVRRATDGSSDYLVAHLFRKDIYLVETVRLDLQDDYRVAQVTWGYDDTEDQDDDEGGDLPSQYDGGRYSVDFVVASSVPSDKYPTAAQLVNNLHKLFTEKSYSCTKLLDKEATVANYKRYLTGGLKGFINVGHGSRDAIYLDDGTLTWKWFDSVPQALKPAVVLLNSCNVHNSPMRDAVMKAGASTYIGGITVLSVGPSEKVSYCFWDKVITKSAQMGDALRTCEQEHYPARGAFGISGNAGSFRSLLASATSEVSV
jgi:hypothetical protein